MERKKIQVWLPLLFSITLIAGMFIGYKMRDAMPGKSFFFTEKRRTIQEVMDIIQAHYVDTVNLDAIADTGIYAMLSQLDPHSLFIPAKEVQAANDDIAGNFFGIGIEFNIFNDTIHVVNVMKDGPSFIAGIQTGDLILKANDSILSGKKLTTESIRQNLRGPLGSPVSLLLLRKGAQKTVIVNRGIIPLSSLDAGYMIDATTGYIRLNKFSKQTYREFMESLTALKKQGLKKLVLDVRGNGGGVLDEAVEIADEFLAGDKLITYTQGSHVKKKEYRCRREGQFETGELVVLADEGSASASEILMAALQDWDRATIVGRRSFGKGLVQEQFDLSNRSALRLTVARYYSPLGRSIQRSYTQGGKAYYDEITDRYTNGGILRADSVTPGGKVFTTKAGKKIYENGGIMPDVFVPADTSKMGSSMMKLYAKGTLNDFGYRYYLANPGIKNQYKTSKDFAQNFALTAADWKTFEEQAGKDSISIAGISDAEKATLTKALKASLGRQLFRVGGYFEVIN
ncbi:MAG: S41 family peptidase, partial [Chitinophagaceae bacterium]